jgi:hypothetical protein
MRGSAKRCADLPLRRVEARRRNLELDWQQHFGAIMHGAGWCGARAWLLWLRAWHWQPG